MRHDSHDHRIEALILDLVEWVAAQPRPYAEVMEAWRTSCPKLAVWEEAVDRGLLVSEAAAMGGVLVAATPSGRRWLEARGRAAAPPPAQTGC
jgi:hypothetical protein